MSKCMDWDIECHEYDWSYVSESTACRLLGQMNQIQPWGLLTWVTTEQVDVLILFLVTYNTVFHGTFSQKQVLLSCCHIYRGKHHLASISLLAASISIYHTLPMSTRPHLSFQLHLLNLYLDLPSHTVHLPNVFLYVLLKKYHVQNSRDQDFDNLTRQPRFVDMSFVVLISVALV
jgi:hypothetical protein